MKKRAIITILVFLLFYFLFIIFNQGYNIKISLSFENLSAFEIDNEVVDDIENKLLQIPKIIDVVSCSRQNKCYIFCKINPLALNKIQIKEKIKSEIYLALLNSNNLSEIEIDDDFETIYKDFVIIYSDKITHFELKKYYEDFLTEFLKLKTTSKILTLAPYETADYIYFTPIILRQYNLNIDDIKKLIQNNNSEISSGRFSNLKSKQNFLLNSKFQNVDDIKNLMMFYKNDDFSTKISDVFKFEKDILKPVEKIAYYNNFPCQVFAFKSKWYIPSIVTKIRLKNKIDDLRKIYPDYVHFKILPLSNYEKIEIYLDEQSNINSTIDFYNKIKNLDNNSIYLIAAPLAKTKIENYFDIELDNRIIVLSHHPKKIIDYLKTQNTLFIKTPKKEHTVISSDLAKLTDEIDKIKKENKILSLFTTKVSNIIFNFDNVSLNEYKIEKPELLNSIKAYYEGLKITDYYDATTKTSVILKNLKNEDEKDKLFIYSKKDRVLLDSTLFYKTELKNDFSAITRKNGYYYSKLIFN